MINEDLCNADLTNFFSQAWKKVLTAKCWVWKKVAEHYRGFRLAQDWGIRDIRLARNQEIL